MNQLLSHKNDSDILQQAWNLDQQALFEKKISSAKKLWAKAEKLCLSLYKTKLPKKDKLQVLAKISTILVHQKKFTKAEKFLQEALKISPRDAIVFHNLGNFYRAKGESQEAIRFYQKACEQDKNPIFLQELKRYKKLLKK